ncbi:MAG: homoserine dehydrogenase, partial [Dehalococcoidia bacterium]
MVAKESIGIGLMGLGVIGSGVAKVLMGKSDTLAREAGSSLVLKKVMEQDLSKHGSMRIEPHLFTTQFAEVVSHPEIDIVIELIGGEHPAFEYIRECLISGKHVVTANKEVMA